MKYTLDATNKKVGRLATEIAVLLMGKNQADFAKNKIPDVTIDVENTSKLYIDPKKLDQKKYYSNSGYPGGLKEESAKHVLNTKGAKEILRKAVMGMLPKNKLRPEMIKRLNLKD